MRFVDLFQLVLHGGRKTQNDICSSKGTASGDEACVRAVMEENSTPKSSHSEIDIISNLGTVWCAWGLLTFGAEPSHVVASQRSTKMAPKRSFLQRRVSLPHRQNISETGKKADTHTAREEEGRDRERDAHTKEIKVFVRCTET